MIRYTVKLNDLNLHCFEVTLTISKPLNNQRVMMPCWIPGSYVIRDFAKNLSKLTFFQADHPLNFKQTNSNEWVVDTTCEAPLSVRYLIYAFDKSVRGAFLDPERGFFNSTSLCLCPVGLENESIELEIVNPGLDWVLVTGLACGSNTKRYDFGLYQAKNYAQLIDCPVSMGRLKIKSFVIQEVIHDIAISGDPEADLDRLTADVQAICKTQIAFFDHLPKEVNYYCFLLHVSHEGYGGIEHVNSCSLLINKFALPCIGESSQSKAYIELLGLFSHEYFHLWMVKQIKPAIFMHYDLTQPNYTTQLWAFEGFTAYYDDLMLVRARLISPEQYFKILAENIGKLFKTPGRKQQTLHSASFDAWIKFYKPNENSINSTVSYYLKGALLALCCDLQLRMARSESKSLDNIIKLLWKDYGQKSRGVEENEVEALLVQSNKDLQTLLTTGLTQTVELPIEPILKAFGLELIKQINVQALDFAAKLVDGSGGVLCQEVYQGGIMHALGVQAGDIVVACQSQRITYQNYQVVFQRYVNQRIDLVIFREDKLKIVTGVFNPIFINQLELKVIPGFENNINKWLLDN